MPEFDPEAFLKSDIATKPKPSFDPEQWLKSTQTPAATQKPTGFDPVQFLTETKYNPVEHAAENWNDQATKDAAFEVYKQQTRNAPPMTAGGVAKDTLEWAKGAIPWKTNGVWQWPAVSGAWQLTKGIAYTGKNIAETQGNPNQFHWGMLGGPVVNAAVNWWKEDPTSVRAGRQIGVGLEKAALDAARMSAHARQNISEAAGTLTGNTVGTKAKNLSDEELRKRFNDEVEAHYLDTQLSKGKYAEEAEGASPVGMTPEELAAKGKPINPEEIQGIAATTNPTNFIELGAITHPLGKSVMAPLVTATGKAVTGTANLLEKVHAGPVAGIGTAIYSMAHGNPLGGIVEGIAAPIASKVATNTGRAAGKMITEAGQEMAGAAPELGQSAVRKIAKESIKSAASAVPGAAAFSVAGQTPEESGNLFWGGVGLGAILGTVSAVPKAGKSGAIEQSAMASKLASDGAAMNFGVGFDALHQEAMQKMSPQAADLLNKYRGFAGRLKTPDGKPIQIYAVNGDKFSSIQQRLGEVDSATGQASNPNGRGMISPDGSQLFINVDAHGNINDPLAHETGHAVAELAGQFTDGLLNESLKANLAKHLYAQNADGTPDLTKPTPEFQKFFDTYSKAVGQAKAASMSLADFESEYIAETARKILEGGNIEKYALPKSTLDGINDWLRTNLGIQPAAGKLGFNGTEIREITKNVADLLHGAGTMEAKPASAQFRLNQLEEILRTPPKANATVEELTAFDNARKEYESLKKKAEATKTAPFPAAGAPPARPSAPTVPPTRTAQQTKVAAALRLNGFSKTEAAQWASVAQGNSIEDMIVDALKKQAAQKFNTAPPPATTPNERPLSTPPPNESVPTGTVPPDEIGNVAVQTAENAPNEEAPVLPNGHPEETERVKQLVQQAEANAIAAERNPSTKIAKERIQRAKIKALLDDIGDDKTGLHREVDQFGNESIVGDFDPSNPRHLALAEVGGGLSQRDTATLEGMQANKGRVIYAKYRSALSNAEQSQALTGEATRENTDTGMNTRQREYEEDPAAARTAGTVQSKVIIPIGTEMTTKNGTIISKFMVLDNLLHNVRSIFDGLPSIGRENPYGNDPRQQEQLLVQDAQAYAENHANGYRGDGSGPMTRFPDSGLPERNPNYQPTEIPADRFAILNMAFHSEGAGRLGDLLAKRDAYAKQGKEFPKAIRAQLAKAQEAQALAKANNPWVDHQTGETNQLRSELKAGGFDTGDKMKSPFETLSPKHILETSDQRLPVKEGEVATVRPHGFTIDPAALATKGVPNPKAVRAAFLPTDTGEEGAPKGAAGQPQQETQGENLSAGAASKEDTGKRGDSNAPEEGQTLGERLAREAEQAGVVLSMATIRGLIQENPDIIARLRTRIQEKTGRPARFMPRIAGPALLNPDGTLEKGKIGDEHRMLMQNAAKRGDDFTDAEHVFYDSEGNVVDREKAWQMAKSDGMIKPTVMAAKERIAAREGVAPKLASQDLIPSKNDQVQRLRSAYDRVVSDRARNPWGFRDVYISDVIKEAGLSLEEGKNLIRSLRGRGVQIGGGDWSLSNDEQKAAGIERGGRSIGKDVMMHFEPEEMSKEEHGKFMPAERYNPKSEKSPIINESDPAWIQRFEQLSAKENRTTLTKEEEDELDALHSALDKQYGSLFAFDAMRKREQNR